MADKTTTLNALRREIDRIDDEIHDLVMRRTRVVEDVRNVKRGERIKIRPAREAEIVYRLMARHRGPFPRRELVRIWRELIVATLSFEGPFSVAVHVPEGDTGIWDLARDQYGSFTPMTRHANPRAAIQAVRDQQATVGVLPLPRSDDTDPWWRHLMTKSAMAPRVIARLPVAPASGRGEHPEALVICPIASEPTGRDRTYLAVDSENGLTAEQAADALRAMGIDARAVASWRDDASPLRFHLLDAAGHFPADDRRLADFGETQNLPKVHVLVLGGYAEPLSAEELDRVAPDEAREQGSPVEDAAPTPAKKPVPKKAAKKAKGRGR